jgi:hypothetical protein
VAALGDAASLSLRVAWFECAILDGVPALGDPETMTWANFASVFEWRREGEKDGPGFVTARFRLERDARHVRRVKNNLLARTAIALDIETSKKTGEVPPMLNEALGRVVAMGLAAVGYTSHSHKPGDTRYRLVLPLSQEIPHELPACEVVAQSFGLDGVLDTSKVGAASYFYLPSATWECPEDQHQTIILPGAPIDAAWVIQAAGGVQAARQAEADRIAVQAHAEAEARRQAKLAAGFDPDASLIEKLRSRFDLDSVLTGHGYAKAGTKYRHPNSSSGQYGADIKTFGGIERVFSHNATDPLHADNLPAWCDVTAIDAFDAVVILDHGGDRQKAMVELAKRFGLTKAIERKALAGMIFRMMRAGIGQTAIEAAARAEGERLGLSWPEICQVATWIAGQNREAA